MQNITPLHVNDQIEARLALREASYNGADFGVEYSDLRLDNTGAIVDNKYASVRKDNGLILGIHSKSYKPLTHKQMIDNQREIIIRSGLADGSIKETISLDKTGKKCYVKHDLPNHYLYTPDGDKANLRFLSTNSFNGVWAYIVSAGAKQGACQNNQLFLNDVATLYKSRHNIHLNLDHAADIMTKAVPIFMEQSEVWHRWHGTRCNNYKALRIFADVVQKPEIANSLQRHMAPSESDGNHGVIEVVDGIHFTEQENIKNNRNFLHLWDRWNTHYKNALGQNLWGVYNTLTDWSTHVSKSNAPTYSASIQHTRENKVQKVLNKDEWGFKIAV
jgi:hypothetical protein